MAHQICGEPGKEADAQQIGSLPIEHQLGRAATLVDFLLDCRLDSRLKMHLEIRGTSVHSCYDAFNKLEPNVNEGNLDFFVVRGRITAGFVHAKEIE